jgi:hypothetical protein
MPRATWVQTSFNGGEWSPLVYGRFDVQRYKTALATCSNYLPTVQGGLTKRSGTRFVAAVKNSANPVRLVRFEFSITQAYVLEFGPGYIRFFLNDGQLLNGGTPYEIASPYGANDLWGLSFTQSADTLYIAHPSYPPNKLQRAGATNWSINAVVPLDGPYLPINASTTTLTPSGATGTVTLTASSTAGINGGVGFRSTDVGRSVRIKCGGGIWQWGTIASVTDSTHVQFTWAALTGAQLPVTATIHGVASGGNILTSAVDNGGGGYGTTPPTLTFGGTGTGATGYATLTLGVVTGVQMVTTGSGYGTGSVPVTVSAPAPIVASSTTFWRLGVWNATDGYPAAVTFHQDRLTWGGSPGYPSRVDGSNTGDYENYAPSLFDGTVVDSSAISFTLNARAASTIQWLVSDEWGLIVGTASSEWVISPGTLQQATTPTNISARQVSNYGCSPVAPVRAGKALLFLQRTGRKVREMMYQYLGGTFQAPDVSQLAEHLTKGGMKQFDMQLAPQQTVWAVRNDGSLVAIVYDKDQDVCGWSQHTIGGTGVSVESVCCIPAPGIQRDETWVVVKRTINGQTVRYVEVMTKLWEDGDSVSTAVFLDSSAQYSGAATTTITGLTWLIGQTVGVLTDGATHPDCVVSNAGTITLQRTAQLAQVGLKYTSSGTTMRIEAGGADGPAQGKTKRIFRTVFRFFQSLGFNAVSDYTGVTPFPEPFRTSADPMGSAPGLFTGDKRWAWEGSWTPEGQISWTHTDPLPSNITMLMAQLETSDNE